MHHAQRKEQVDSDREKGEEKLARVEMIIALDNSHSYATTHMVVARLRGVGTWDNEDREELFKIALNNSQVKGVLNDPDIKSFYQHLIKTAERLSDNAARVKKITESI